MEWIRVKDETPPDSVDIWFYGKEWDDKAACHGWYVNGKWFDCEWSNDPIGDGVITHWMKFPDIPEEDNE